MLGSCLCGQIKYEVACFDPEISNCHCAMCRKFHGAAYATYGKVQRQDFRWLQGQALILTYQSSITAERGFCKCCGSSLYYKFIDQDDQISIAIGTLDEEPSRSVDNSIFVLQSHAGRFATRIFLSIQSGETLLSALHPSYRQRPHQPLRVLLGWSPAPFAEQAQPRLFPILALALREPIHHELA